MILKVFCRLLCRLKMFVFLNVFRVNSSLKSLEYSNDLLIYRQIFGTTTHIGKHLVPHLIWAHFLKY